MSQAPSPFQLTYSPNLPELLHDLRCTLVISTYQAGKVIFLSPRDKNQLIQLPRTFHKPMGFTFSEDFSRMALATKFAITTFQNSPELAHHYPIKPATYDAMFMPRVSYHTNALDIHDLALVGDDVYGVNTLFSCIMKTSNKFTFEPVWKPHFIDAIVSEDRCHLNGMVLEDGEILYCTAFNEGNSFQSWTKSLTDTGILISAKDQMVMSRGLAMPHSPLLVDKELFLLESAKGTLVQVDRNSGSYQVVKKLGGFVRGLSFHQGYFFIGHSRLRKNSSSFGKLDIDQKDDYAAITVLHKDSNAIVGKITYQSSVDEIYDVDVLPDCIRPNILTIAKEESRLGVTIPESTFWARPST